MLAEDAPKNCSLRRDSGTGLTMNLRPAECTTWAAVLGDMPEGIIKGRSDIKMCFLKVKSGNSVLNVWR